MVDQQSFNELALFAGAGGGILGSTLLGWRTVCAVEIDAYAASVLIARQNDGILSPFPIWDDIRTFDGKPWNGIVDVVSGGFPCQDISAAGKGAGIDGTRSGLWREMARIIREVRPQFAFVENSPMLVNRGLGRVLGDLAEMGYDASWCVLGADDVGAPHIRKRLWIFAYSNSNRFQRQHSSSGEYATAEKEWTDIKRVVGEIYQGTRDGIPESWILRKGNGMAARVDRLKALGNGQVPIVAAIAWEMLSKIVLKNSEF